MKQLTKEQAIALYESGWWKNVDERKAALFQLAQPLLCMNFTAFHKATETLLDRSVWTHEFTDPAGLLAEAKGDRTPPTLQEIIDMLPADKTVIFVAPDEEEG